MHQRRIRLRRSFALGAAAAVAAGGLLVGSPAFADDAVAEAPVAGHAYEAKAKELIAAEGDDLAAIGRDEDDNFVIVKVAGSDTASADDFAEQHSNVLVQEVSAPLTSYAANDVVGGAGYFSVENEDSLYASACSIGFSAWSPEGEPAIISAGHCTGDGVQTITVLTRPSTEPAVGGEGYEAVAGLGYFGFSQFGGPGNSIGAEGDLSSIDISVIDVTNDDLELLPEVTDWTTAGVDDLAASTIPVTAVGKPVLGEPVAKSGRTTGFTDGVDVDLIDGWARVEDRWVHGFSATGLLAAPGDSGGAVIQGTTAVGVLSGGDEASGFTWAAELVNALEYIDGYTVMLDIEEPVLTSPSNGGDVERGEAISGTGPASTTLVVTPAGGTPFEVTTDSSGNWSFPAPNALGSYAFEIFARDGFNESDVNAYDVNVVPAPLNAPVITSPADGASVETEVTQITGTGLPGATVEVSGDVTGTTVVQGDGSWTIAAELGYGSYEVTVTQSADDQTSPAATSAFDVVVPAPVISSPSDGQEFAHDAAPTAVSGTGIEGAEIVVTIDGEEVGTATVIDGAWSIELDEAVLVGPHTIVVTQTVDGAFSSTAEATFVVASAPTVPAPGDGPGTEPGAAGPRDGDLANTGLDLAPFLGASVLLLAAGAAIVIIRARRRATAE